MKNVTKMTKDEIKAEMEILRNSMEYSIQARLSAQEVYDSQLARYTELSDEYHGRKEIRK